MADVQLENGFTQLANELLEILGQFKFTRLQMIAIHTVWRFSYGFHKLYADFPKQSDMAMYGIPLNKVGATLRTLEEKGVFKIDWTKGRIWFQKNYDTWDQLLRIDCFDVERHQDLLDYNKEDEHIATVIGWAKASRGGGRKAIRFTKSESTDSQKVNQIDDKANDSKDTIVLDSQKVNQNRFTKSESNRVLGSRSVNQQVNETVIKSAEKVNENADFDSPKYRSKDNIYIYNNINTEEQEACQPDNDLLTRLEFLPGIIDISRTQDKAYFEYISKFPEEQISVVLTEAQRRAKLGSKDNERLQRKSVLKFIAGGLENYDRLYKHIKPTPEQKVSNARRVYEQILNDEEADKEDESYQKALADARAELQKAEEAYNVTSEHT